METGGHSGLWDSYEDPMIAVGTGRDLSLQNQPRKKTKGKWIPAQGRNDEQNRIHP